MAENELYPTPLWFQVPKDVLDDVLNDHFCELGPGMLCFETFYQAVALTWPHEYSVIDIGGYVGVQGWLFRDFASYIDVDVPLNAHRCKLPDNGRHVNAEGVGYLAQIRQFDVDLDHDLFICSAVPNEIVREAVKAMPNHVVWYPGKKMVASGPFARETVAFFRRLKSEGYDEANEKAVFAAIQLEKGQQRA